MSILNYTTQIKALKTVGEIQTMLAEAGAQAVLTEYDGGDVSALSFRLEHNGQLISFRLPVRTEEIYVVLQNDPDIPRKLKTLEQATRVAWRIIKVWTAAQLALIEAEQADMVQAFLPYVQDSKGQTLYERLEQTDFKLLEHGGD